MINFPQLFPYLEYVLCFIFLLLLFHTIFIIKTTKLARNKRKKIHKTLFLFLFHTFIIMLATVVACLLGWQQCVCVCNVAAICFLLLKVLVNVVQAQKNNVQLTNEAAAVVFVVVRYCVALGFCCSCCSFVFLFLVVRYFCSATSMFLNMHVGRCYIMLK